LPGTLAYLVMAAETGGGALLILGVYSRWGALALVPVLLGALAAVHWPNGRVFSALRGGWKYPAFLAVATTAQGLPASGAFALKNK
jgi:putative oxidoreductase